MFKVEKQGAVDVITGRDPVNKDYAQSISDILEECRRAGQPMVVIDMHEIQLLDSAGLEVLLSAQETFEACGGSLKLAEPNSLCRDILEVTSVADHFEIFDDTRLAVRSFLR